MFLDFVFADNCELKHCQSRKLEMEEIYINGLGLIPAPYLAIFERGWEGGGG